MLSFNYINFPREVNENVFNNCKKIVSFSFSCICLDCKLSRNGKKINDNEKCVILNLLLLPAFLTCHRLARQRRYGGWEKIFLFRNHTQFN